MQFTSGKKEKDAFYGIKQAIIEELALYNPYFNKDFLLYTFTSNTSLATVLTQKHDQKNERSISFMSASLQGPELNHLAINK